MLAYLFAAFLHLSTALVPLMVASTEAALGKPRFTFHEQYNCIARNGVLDLFAHVSLSRFHNQS